MAAQPASTLPPLTFSLTPGALAGSGIAEPPSAVDLRTASLLTDDVLKIFHWRNRTG